MQAEALLPAGPGHQLEFDDRHSAASTYHQLGMVAQEQRRFEQAEDYYRQALDIFLEFDDRHSAATTYHQLGVVAQEQRRLEQAEHYYRQALDIFLEFDDRYAPPAPITSSAGWRRSSGGSSRPRHYYRQALDIKLEFDDRHSAATTLSQFGNLAEDRQQLRRCGLLAFESAVDSYGVRCTRGEQKHSTAASVSRRPRRGQVQHYRHSGSGCPSRPISFGSSMSGQREPVSACPQRHV